jgi:hypothetical protein
VRGNYQGSTIRPSLYSNAAVHPVATAPGPSRGGPRRWRFSAFHGKALVQGLKLDRRGGMG